MVSPRIPPQIEEYILRHTRNGSKMRKDLLDLLKRMTRGEKIRYEDIKSMSVKYHIQRMRRLNLLVTIRANEVTYIAINPDLYSNKLLLSKDF